MVLNDKTLGVVVPGSSSQITVFVSLADKGQVLVEVLPGVAHAFLGTGVSLSGNLGSWTPRQYQKPGSLSAA